MSTSNIRLLVGRELSAALRERWLVGYTAVFLLGGLFMAWFGLEGTSVYGYRGFARALAGLAHLAMLFVPLMALFPAAASIADDRERGVLDYLLAQPVSRLEVFAGKGIGVAIAVCLALTVGMSASGLVALARGVPLGLVAALYGFVTLLALVFVAVGLGLSVVAASRARALSFGIGTWLFFVAFGTLGVMIAFVRWGLPAWVLVGWTFVNPVEAFRIGVTTVLDPDLSILGPVGLRIAEGLGHVGAGWTAAVSLLLWTGLATLVGAWRFRRPPPH